MQYVRGLINKYLEWVHFSSTLCHTVTGLFWTCQDMFLSALNKRDLTEVVQTQMQVNSCVCGMCNTCEVWEYWSMHSEFCTKLMKIRTECKEQLKLSSERRPWAIWKFLRGYTTLRWAHICRKWRVFFTSSIQQKWRSESKMWWEQIED